jgi:hypothetical protein
MFKRSTLVVIVLTTLSCALPTFAAKKPSGGGGGSGSGGSGGSGSTSPVKMLIQAGGDLISDGLKGDLYTDYTDSVDGDSPGLCVSGGFNSTGFTAVYPDRQLSDGTFCNSDSLILSGHPARTYSLHLPADACDALGAEADASGYCTVTADVEGYQRFELGSPFARKPSASGRFAFDYAGSRWSVITDDPAMVQSDGETRVISYGGTATLNQVIDGVPTPLTDPFPFTFTLSVQRVQ